jgi:hypothetical protein
MLSGFTLIKAALLSAAFLFVATGCAAPESFGGSRASTVEWASARGFEVGELAAGPFHLLALMRRSARGSGTLSVYIEGDGAPWMTAWHPPRDPTPLKPIALAMAAADTAVAVVYLGRPCQYLAAVELATCDPTWWMERRFAPEVLMAYDEALAQLKVTHGAQRLRLVGYSGGGVIAALLAARRSDVERLVTVAAPLALNEWVAWHDLTPFAGSSDPYLEPGYLPSGVHWVGEKDKIVPPGIIENFVRKKGGRIFVMPGYDHECCWARDWASLIAKESME